MSTFPGTLKRWTFVIAPQNPNRLSYRRLRYCYNVCYSTICSLSHFLLRLIGDILSQLHSLYITIGPDRVLSSSVRTSSVLVILVLSWTHDTRSRNRRHKSTHFFSGAGFRCRFFVPWVRNENFWRLFTFIWTNVSTSSLHVIAVDWRLAI